MNDDHAFEDELRAALSGEERSVVEPAGLAERLVDRAQRSPHRHRVRWRNTGWLPLLASVTALVIVAAGAAVTRSALSDSHHAPAGTSVPRPSSSPTEVPSPTPSTSAETSSSPSPSHSVVAPPPARSTSSGHAPACRTGHELASGPSTITVCPAAARVGDAVTITLVGRCGGAGNGPILVFLGPKQGIGTGQGGTEIPLAPTRTGFRATFTVPHVNSGPVQQNGQLSEVPVTPGSGYSFSTYPAGACPVPFRVRAGQGSGASNAGSGSWGSSDLVITENSLGAVQRGMTNDAAQRAAGVSLAGIGDGIVRPADASIGGSTQLQYSWGTTCFDAFRSHRGSGTRVVTPAGVGLGDPMSRVRSAYPNATTFTADPNWGGPGNVKGGLLVRFGDGVLLLVGSSSDLRDGTITSIRGAPTAQTASSYFC